MISPLAAEKLRVKGHDVVPGRRVALFDEVDLPFGRMAGIGGDVPEVAEPVRTLPDRDLAPLDLDPGRRALEDAATGPALEHDLEALFGADRVGDGPPARGARGPDREGVVGRAGHLERDPDRFDHRPRPAGFVFSARSRKRAAASPQTEVR